MLVAGKLQKAIIQIENGKISKVTLGDDCQIDIGASPMEVREKKDPSIIPNKFISNGSKFS